MSDVQGAGGQARMEGMYSEDQCIMGNDDIGTSPSCEQADTSENITFPQLRWRE